MAFRVLTSQYETIRSKIKNPSFENEKDVEMGVGTTDLEQSLSEVENLITEIKKRSKIIQNI